MRRRKGRRSAPVAGPVEFEAADLPTLGWVTVTGCGEENVYLTLADGTRAFVKLG